MKNPALAPPVSESGGGMHQFRGPALSKKPCVTLQKPITVTVAHWALLSGDEPVLVGFNLNVFPGRRDRFSSAEYRWQLTQNVLGEA